MKNPEEHDNQQHEREGIRPSVFMRQLRPELYSDTEARTAYQLDAPTLEYHLETITARNQTHDFEIFCRKLCERTICPHLKPATGPEGGGDSKADTETIPVADEIATLTYVGEANAGQERWAFAFSAKKKWAEKVRSDVAGIVATNRGYQRIYCVTSQFARAKDRAAMEDELTKQHGVPVTILDRTWIVEQIIDHDRKDLAFNYLGLGQEIADTRRLGPSDYSRAQQLDDIEKAFKDPHAFDGMKMQRVTEALIAAKLSRNLERPGIETDGRFERAIRLAHADGSYRQQLEAQYEKIWTGFWWFDDIALLNNSYDAFEALTFKTDHAKNLELLCNLAQLLFNTVIHRHLSAEEARLTERITRLSDRLKVMAADAERPNNALEARTSLLILQVNQAFLGQERETLAALWSDFSDVLKCARGLGEFSAERLIKMIEVFGDIAGKDTGYAHLVDELAEFVSERTSEGQGALVLLNRARQLDFDDKFEMIRLVGKAVHQLTKKEYAESYIEATQLLSVAYRSAGLLWAARASCIFSITSIFIEADENSDLPASIVPTLMLLGWISVELRHLPEFLEAIRLIRGCAASLPLDDSSQKRVAKRLQQFDLSLGSQLLNLAPSELERIAGLPDVLDRLELFTSRAALLYALGYEQQLRGDGSLPADEAPEKAAELFTMLASQPVSDDPHGPLILNESRRQTYVSTVLGMRVEVHHQGSETSILVAEAVIGSIEALFATTLELIALAHTELFSITIEERTDAAEPTFTVDEKQQIATVRWPAGFRPATFENQESINKMLVQLSGTIFVATCGTDDMEATLNRFFDDEAVQYRIAMISVVGNSHQRVFKSGIARLDDWTTLAQTAFPLRPDHPTIVRRKLESGSETEDDTEIEDAGHEFQRWSKDHREFSVRSIIDVHLWNEAGWVGIAFAAWGPSNPPAMALMFTNAESARKIFEHWHQRFGKIDQNEEIFLAVVRGISVTNPAHYRLLITSNVRGENKDDRGQKIMVASRIHTMEAESDINLARFLDAYNKVGAYVLMPAVWTGNGAPEFLSDLSISKRQLSVKLASEIGEHDIETVAIKVSH